MHRLTPLNRQPFSCSHSNEIEFSYSTFELFIGFDVHYSAPDLEDVRESVRQGVTKVATRLSSLASGVMTSLQDKYGG